ncbi:unnamed protein product [Caenorhabditis sp. 36 PRJEB53466]|nr:unnamed protein product [Caenorhabditis sp. 36 PRJEB53466]
MIRSLLVLTLLVGYSTAQYVQQQQQRSAAAQQQPSVQAAQPEALDQIPAWYQMAKPGASRVQQLPQASPSYYERIEPTYEQRRGDQATYERPGIQTNQYANYPSYQNRQPYENLNALTSGASLSNLQANRRYPSGAASAGGQDMPYDSALKRYHKLLLKRRQWTTKIGRILASTTPMTPSTAVPTSTSTTTTTTTTEAPTTTTKKMPKSLKSIYSTIIPKTTTTTEEPTSSTTAVPSTTTRMNGRLVGKPRGTFKPHGTRKGWRMWKKVTPKYVAKLSSTTTEVPITSTTSPTEPSTISTSTSTTTDLPPTTPDLRLIEEEQELTTSTTTTEQSSTSITTTTTTTEEPTATSATTKGSEEQQGGKIPSSLSERRASTIGPFRPISVGHKWKPLRFKKPEPVDEVATVPATTNRTISTRPKGLRLLEYLLPNTELLAAIKDVVAKFKASLDEAGIDQDVRLMGNQLKNTWQQLRTGPMNEQIGRLFEKAVADAADQKQQQAIQQVQQQMVASRP